MALSLALFAGSCCLTDDVRTNYARRCLSISLHGSESRRSSDLEGKAQSVISQPSGCWLLPFATELPEPSDSLGHARAANVRRRRRSTSNSAVLIGLTSPFLESWRMGRGCSSSTPLFMALDRVLADGVVFRMSFDMPADRAHYFPGWRTHDIHNHQGEQFPNRIS